MMSVSSSEQVSTVKAESFGWTMWALIIWLAGAALIFARLIVGIASVWWVVNARKKSTKMCG